MRTRLRWVTRGSAALVGSFAVYLIPLIGPHAAWLLGEHLYRAITRGGADRSPTWTAAEIAVALVAQGALYAVLAWAFARRSVFRILTVVAAAPAFFIFLEWAYLLAIPSYFLIEHDVAPEVSAWTDECFLPNVSLATVRTPPGLPLESSARVWVNDGTAGSYALLESCERRRAVDLGTQASLITAPFVLADGKALFAVWDKSASRNVWWYAAGDGSQPALLDRPPADPNRSSPILSNDGAWTAWKEYVPGVTRTPLPEQIVIRSLGDPREWIVPMPPPGPAAIELLGVDTSAEIVTLFEHDDSSRANRIVTLGFDGLPRGDPLLAVGADPQSVSMLASGHGWVAWDAYRESGRYRVAWSLPGGSGSSEVRLGRSITAADVDPSGSYVAISTTTTLNIGRIRDSVYVVKTRDGSEAFRRYLPTYARSRVAFLGTGRFAFDDQDGGRFGLRILRFP